MQKSIFTYRARNTNMFFSEVSPIECVYEVFVNGANIGQGTNSECLIMAHKYLQDTDSYGKCEDLDADIKLKPILWEGKEQLELCLS